MTFLAETTLAPRATVDLWPLAVLGIGMGAIIVMITKLRVHAFLALLFAAVLTGILSGPLPGERVAEGGALENPATKPAGGSGKAGKRHLVQAVELTVDGFGKTAGQIGIVIAL